MSGQEGAFTAADIGAERKKQALQQRMTKLDLGNGARQLHQNYLPLPGFNGTAAPGVGGIIGAAVAGTGIPFPVSANWKPRALGAKGSYTSAFSRLARATPLRDIPLNKYLPFKTIRTPTIYSKLAEAGKFGTLIGRAAIPLGAALTAADIYFSKNRLRAAAGDMGGLLGGGILGTAGSLIGPEGTVAGGILGSSLGNEAGLALYDDWLGHTSAHGGGW